jgi:hypothetical protein
MDLKRKLAMVVLTLGIAFACGQFVQYGTGGGPRLASLPPEAEPTPRAIVPLAADSVEVITAPVEAPPAPRLPDQALLPATADLPSAIALPTEPATLPPLTAATPLDCPVQFDVTAQPGAMLGITMLAPCHANQRVVLRHAGLAFTGKTSATGGLFLTMPGLEADAEVSVLFADGDTVAGQTRLPCNGWRMTCSSFMPLKTVPITVRRAMFRQPIRSGRRQVCPPAAAFCQRWGIQRSICRCWPRCIPFPNPPRCPCRW